MNKNFIQAVADYSYLSEQGYHPRWFIDLVGNRYSLSEQDKTVLYRGVVLSSKCYSRKQKIITPEKKLSPIFIDGFNVISTITSYLLGLPVYVAMDGLLRDAANKRGDLDTNPKLTETIDLILKYLSERNLHHPVFYLDQQVKTSDETAHLIMHSSYAKFVFPECKQSQHVDDELIRMADGTICTSDSGIIDDTQAVVFDLAQHVLKYFHTPNFVDLGSLNDLTDF